MRPASVPLSGRWTRVLSTVHRRTFAASRPYSTHDCWSPVDRSCHLIGRVGDGAPCRREPDRTSAVLGITAPQALGHAVPEPRDDLVANLRDRAVV